MPSQREFARRRRQLMQTMGPGAVAILPAAPERRRSRDIFHSYRQDSDFWYLTGFDEPSAVAVIAPGRAHGEYILFCRDKDAHHEAWDGPRAGPEGACAAFGADDAFPIDDLNDILPGLLEGRERIYYAMGRHRDFDQRLLAWVNLLKDKGEGGHEAHQIVALDHVLQDMRCYKSREEIRALRSAAAVSVEAHLRAMRACRPGMMEYEIEAELLHTFRRHGLEAAYPSIVAGGPNACTLHYIHNRAPLKDGDLLLIDAGCEYELYASDISRTFPVNGRFSREQQALYELVLASQDAAFETLRPGAGWNDAHARVIEVITQGLVDLGILEGHPDELVASEAYRPYFMHRTGHWLGLDVHDVGEYRVDGHWRQLEAGMVLTVEPGIYINADCSAVDARWRGIGIRIEDDVLITSEGHELLSVGLPRSAREVEAEMSGARAA
ncbi:aminopeptidase P N-terminal domain-containing protein [Natronospira bacteriovora]|uniref:Xaa-Pro aminopeptidase n=1 Tax=Natronospira bacteriovora TaxID=3069753 RepID=A0ABU0W8K9_9GAMM|nr:aminopeptidase P N-terminal domain-containing protein [Natronospira sp. AB-CW4]MDQ2070370.1 aminopeptidase P N-terminal domain-containing protein [Natronospira sp. AB-CW4]